MIEEEWVYDRRAKNDWSLIPANEKEPGSQQRKGTRSPCTLVISRAFFQPGWTVETSWRENTQKESHGGLLFESNWAKPTIPTMPQLRCYSAPYKSPWKTWAPAGFLKAQPTGFMGLWIQRERGGVSPGRAATLSVTSRGWRGHGDVCLWRGTGEHRDTCQTLMLNLSPGHTDRWTTSLLCPSPVF